MNRLMNAEARAAKTTASKNGKLRLTDRRAAAYAPIPKKAA